MTIRIWAALIAAALAGLVAGVLVSDVLLVPPPARQATIHPAEGRP